VAADGPRRVSVVGTTGSGKSTVGPAWVVDGNYPRVVMEGPVWRRADTVVWLDLPRPTVMRQVVLRTLRRVLTRQTLWNGNREPFSNLWSARPRALGHRLGVDAAPFLSSGHEGVLAGPPRTVLGGLGPGRGPSPSLPLAPERGARRPPGPARTLSSPSSRRAWPIAL
jgi:hypothetical protein